MKVLLAVTVSVVIMFGVYTYNMVSTLHNYNDSVQESIESLYD